MIQLKGQYQLSDFKAAQKLHVQRGRLSSCAGYYVIGMLAVTALSGIFLTWRDLSFSPVFYIPAGILSLWALLQFVLLPYQQARVFTQQKELSAPFELEADDAGFHFRNDYSSTRVPWGDFAKWKENKDILVLYRSDIVFHMLPKHLFHSQSEIDYVLDKLREQGVPNARKVRNPVQVAVVVILVIIAIGIAVVQFLAQSTAR